MCRPPFVILPMDDSGEAVPTPSLPSAAKLTLRRGVLLWGLSETQPCEGQLPPHSAALFSGG